MEIPKWTGTLIGNMHNNKVSKSELAKYMGLSVEYVSMVLNGKRTPDEAQERFEKALDELIKCKEQERS